MTVDWEAVYAETSKHIGIAAEQRLGRVTALQFQRFAIAAGETAARYYDNTEAVRQGLPGVVAPPLFLSAVMGWEAGPDEQSLRRDGTGRAEVASLPLTGLRLMGAGQELEFLNPVVDAQDITQKVSVDSAHLKQGKSGQMLLFTLLRRYFDQHGTELLRCHETFIAR